MVLLHCQLTTPRLARRVDPAQLGPHALIALVDKHTPYGWVLAASLALFDVLTLGLALPQQRTMLGLVLETDAQVGHRTGKVTRHVDGDAGLDNSTLDLEAVELCLPEK